QGGGLWLQGNSTLIQTTVSGNSAAGPGGGIFSQSENLQIANSTITDNRASDGAGGVHMQNYRPPSLKISLASTILADNQGTTGNFQNEVVNGGGVIQLNTSASLFGDDPSEVNGTNTATIFNDHPD